MNKRIIDFRFWGVRKINKATKILKKYELEYQINYAGEEWFDRRKYFINEIYVHMDADAENYEKILEELRECKG